MKFFSDFRVTCLAPISKANKNRKQKKAIDRRLADGWISLDEKDNNLPKIRTYYDFSNITSIDTSAALILTAEYDRLSKLIKKVPVTINLEDWSEQVFQKLYELGFFEVLQLTSDVKERYRDNGHTRTMKILSGSDAGEIQIASEKLMELCHFIDPGVELDDDQRIAINTAVSEGMINVARHAYKTTPDYDFEYEHVKSWWLTATADRLNRRLTIALFDQGASIPVTLPKQPQWKALLDRVFPTVAANEDGHKYRNDGRYIQTALKLRETSTEEPGRGLGLPQMKELIDTFNLGSLTIWSRGGQCTYNGYGKSSVDSHIYSVGGTLIEWIIELPKAKSDG
ncbi:ATP-binding protein [Roseibium sp.]|uniref:ATP-binding protein n=1 Tax=Roseibium sp. TaxID=1936156 RepID=UPI003B50D2DB